MEDSTSRAAKPGHPESGASSAWRLIQLRVTSFLEAVGEILRGMDHARQVHPTISAYHDPHR